MEFFSLFREYALPPSSIVVELTESGQIENSPKIQSIWENLRKYGINIALDDFGTGYSSLNHIREIPFDVIKVDQSFIKDLEKDDYAKAATLFEQAAAQSKNEFTTPMYLHKAALAYAAAGDEAKAKQCYETIEKEYPRSMDARDAMKQLAE